MEFSVGVADLAVQMDFQTCYFFFLHACIGSIINGCEGIKEDMACK